ncbi:MAG: sensor histidine kinase [Gammaproteobacteria bacterium]
MIAPFDPLDALSPAGALERVAGYSARQGLASALLVGALGLVAWRLRAWDWLGLFVLMLAPVVLAGLAAQALRHVRSLQSLGWAGVWALLLAVIAAASLAAVPAYGRWLMFAGFGALRPLQVFACVGGFGLLALGLPLWHLHARANALHLARLERAALAAELKALQAQIEPHFLYNTLANTRYLVRHDAARAVTMLDHLIGYLRSALPDMRSRGSTVGRECELAEHYLAIMAIRFGERMAYRIDCPDALRDAAVPPLMVMPLVENAVQHGVEPTPGMVRVELIVRAEGGTLRLLVRDNGSGSGGASELGSGVGLRNLRARLAAHYGDGARFDLRIDAGRQAEAELTIPLESKPACSPES